MDHKMCRACLTIGIHLEPMDGACLNNYNALTNLDIKLSDEPLLYSCKTCSDAIKFCTEFRQKCISSDLTLKEIYFMKGNKNNKEDNTALDIKQEENSDFEYESAEYLDLEALTKFDPLVKSKADEDWASDEMKKNLTKKNKKEKKTKLIPELNNYDDDIQHCGICSNNFEDSDSLWKHFEIHKLEKTCGLCKEIFLDFTHLLAHRIAHLPDKQKKCTICSKKFCSPDYLECHYVNSHKLRGEGGKVSCKQCTLQYDSGKKLSKHIWAVHSVIKYYCNECGKGFRVKQHLVLHLRSHNEAKMYKCHLCDFACKFKSGIREHTVRKHTEGRADCKPCGRVFANKKLLEKHKCKHILSIICPICGVYVKHSSRLTRHMRSHSEDFQYKCDRCTKQFRSRSSYKSHMYKHDGTKPFKCQYCPMSFYFKSVLIKHRRTHTGEKPYVCDICSKGFTGNHNLKVHMKVHGLHLVVKREI